MATLDNIDRLILEKLDMSKYTFHIPAELKNGRQLSDKVDQSTVETDTIALYFDDMKVTYACKQFADATDHETTKFDAIAQAFEHVIDQCKKAYIELVNKDAKPEDVEIGWSKWEQVKSGKQLGEFKVFVGTVKQD